MKQLTKNEKEVLRFLLKQELKEFIEQKKELKELRPELAFLTIEEKYDELLDSILEKIK